MTPAGEARRLVVTIVHGTFPRGPLAQCRRDLRARWAHWRGRDADEADLWGPRPTTRDPAWFEAGSAFEHSIVGPLRDRGDVVEVRQFLWSGRNTFTDRAEAAARLRRQLAATCDEFPGVPHAVIAHSHGGTVSVDALDDSTAGAPPVTLLVTLGTPFVQLATRAARLASAMRGWQGPAGVVLPGAVLAFGVLAALACLLRLDGWRDGVAMLLLLVAGRAAVTWRFGQAVLVVLAAALLGGPVVRSDLVALGVLGIFLGIGLLRLPEPPGVRVQPLVRWTPRQLRCPVVALRAPGDEATLAIVGAQALEKLTGVVVRVVGALLQPVVWIVSGLRGGATDASTPTDDAGTQVLGIARALVAGLLVGTLIVGIGWMTGAPVAGVLHWPDGAPWVRVVLLAGQALIVSATGLLGIVALSCALLYALSLGLAATSWAIGPECYWLPLVTRVDAEPLPDVDADTRARMTLEILYDAAGIGLAHSMYDAPEVRARVCTELARLLDAHRPGPSPTVRAPAKHP